ncbi:putative restriction endonuclease [Cyclobacterium lianum]|uniref:Putative restriction endonuclease n=1 Tax=Cyclobacterium lianum TaxID=388280 RepID=A0A1M7JZR8_9BACT|nr:HNH endonuclease [Cyclobacterium lianum]SHM58421.1 putative restriction endonuclease [Cyclobacterium lianum]
MEKQLQKYLHAFRKLRIDRAHGIAPQKPVLLISLLQTFQTGNNISDKVRITPELVAFFNTNWTLLVNTNHHCRFTFPFYHMKTERFWTLVPKMGFEKIIRFSASMRSFTNLNQAVDHVVLDEDLFLLMKDPKSNILLQQFLLEEYFPGTSSNFIFSLENKKKLFDNIESKILYESPEEYRTEIQNLILQQNEEEIFIRGDLFKREIPKIYSHTCGISGMRIDATLDISMIDACHIKPFSQSFDDTIKNGIALCPNLHRAFDRGLISIDENFCVLVSKCFEEQQSAYSIRDFEHKTINLPAKREHWPLQANLQWHRENIFKP